MKISVIMPNYNGSKYLEKSIDSFISQNYTNKELIIIDGKSTDKSHDIISQYTQKYPYIKWIKEKDKGISNAFNIAFKYASGNIIGYMGSDDILYKNLFDTIIYHNGICDFDAIYFNSYVYWIEESKCILRKCPDVPFTKEGLLSSGTIAGWQTIYFKREIYEKFKIDEDNKTCMDYELYLRISNENYLYLYVDSIACFIIMDGNISSDKDGSQFVECCQVTEKYKDGYQGSICFDISRSLTQKPLKQVRKNLISRIVHKLYALIKK